MLHAYENEMPLQKVKPVTSPWQLLQTWKTQLLEVLTSHSLILTDSMETAE